MFTLVSDRSKYFRIKCVATRAEIEKELGCPVFGEIFTGGIVELGERMRTIRTGPHDTYKTISQRLKIDEEELKKANNFKPLYPSCRLFIPCKK